MWAISVIWAAVDQDGTTLRQAPDPFTGVLEPTRPFAGLRLDRIRIFALERPGLRVQLDACTGILSVNGKPLDLRFVTEEGRAVPLSGRGAGYAVEVGWLGLARPAAYLLGWSTAQRDEWLGAWQARFTVVVPADDQQPALALLRTVVERGLRAAFEWFIGGQRVSAVSTIVLPESPHQIVLRFSKEE